VSEKRKYRQFTPEQETEIVLAGLRGDRTVRDVCRAYEISEALYYDWRDRLLEAGKAALAVSRGRGPEATETKELRRRVAQLERPLGGRGWLPLHPCCMSWVRRHSSWRRNKRMSAGRYQSL
jgi:transposase